jgi:hypothetical protein
VVRERAAERLIRALETNGYTVKRRRDERDDAESWRARCPNHNGTSDDSLSITQIGDPERPHEGQALVHCFAGCATKDVLTALKLSMPSLFDDPSMGVIYRYDDGRNVMRGVNGQGKKTFKQAGKTKGRGALFRLKEVTAAAAAGRPIYLVEGEKDVLALEAHGVVATTSP